MAFRVVVKQPKIERIGQVLAQDVLDFPKNCIYLAGKSDPDLIRNNRLEVFHPDNPGFVLATRTGFPRAGIMPDIAINDPNFATDYEGNYQYDVWLYQHTETAKTSEQIRLGLLQELSLHWWQRLGRKFEEAPMLPQIRGLNDEELAKIASQNMMPTLK